MGLVISDGMKHLPESLKQEINQGNFTVKKTNCVFCAMETTVREPMTNILSHLRLMEMLLVLDPFKKEWRFCIFLHLLFKILYFVKYCN